ncbi:MAG: ABC transporter ATP-binding protein [Planctomycetota bacterium]
MLEIRDLHRLHLGPISFGIDAGECVSLQGPSGSGKSLLLRALADLDPHEGEIRLDGATQSEMAGPEWRRRVGYLPAESGWWARTVGEHFVGDADFGALNFGALGFNREVCDWDVSRLSTGERQRLALLRLLANGPDALLLDEPTANLDAGATEAVEAMVQQYRTQRGAPVLWVAHDEAQRRRVASRGYVITGSMLEDD